MEGRIRRLEADARECQRLIRLGWLIRAVVSVFAGAQLALLYVGLFVLPSRPVPLIATAVVCLLGAGVCFVVVSRVIARTARDLAKFQEAIHWERVLG